MNNLTNDKFYAQAKECAEKGDFQKAKENYNLSLIQYRNADSAYELGKLYKKHYLAIGLTKEIAIEEARWAFSKGVELGCKKSQREFIISLYKEEPKNLKEAIRQVLILNEYNDAGIKKILSEALGGEPSQEEKVSFLESCLTIVKEKNSKKSTQDIIKALISKEFYKYKEERKRKEREERERKEREERERKEREEEVEKKRNELKETIQKREIKKLVHFTPKENVESILKCGILPREDLERQGMIFCFNDESRMDKCQDAICLSITSHNHWLLNKFKGKYPCRKYVLFEIKPQILLDMNVKRYYCDYNAAAWDVDSSAVNLEIMFKERQAKIVAGREQNDCRLGKNDNEPTSVQAEILFFGRIAPEDIIGWKEI